MKAFTSIINKKGSFNYQFIDKYVSGIVLKGCEVKSIKLNDVNFIDSYCEFIGNELWVKGLHISQYKFSMKTDEKRDRKLLLNRSELNKLKSNVKEKGLTIIPVRFFSNDYGLIKLEIALSKGKNNHDKRNSIKEKDIKRDMQRELR